VKLVALVAVPPAVVTLHVPLLAPAGTVVVIDVAETTVYEAATPPSATALAPVRFVPVNVTLAPTDPLAGLKLETVGAAGGVVTVKLAELVAVPPPVVTLHVPELAPAGTVVVIDVAETTVYEAATPPSATAVAPVNRVPVSVTLAPVAPLVGEKLVRVGGWTLKLVALVAVPPGAVTFHRPDPAPTGTLVLIDVSELTVNVAAVEPRETAVAPVKPVPVSVTALPAIPLAGVKLVIVGAGTVTLKVPALVAVPPGVVTLH
jgi:hypothetical protein